MADPIGTVTVIAPVSTNTEGAIAGSSPASTGLTGGRGFGFSAATTNGIGLNPGPAPTSPVSVATNATSNLNSASSAPAPGGIKTSAPTIPIGNPMHQFASWSYSWSLWWLDVNDYNALMAGLDAGAALAYPLGPKSYVVAEDSGLYPDRRLPTQLGLNYNIQNVEFNTVVGLNSSSKSSNMIDGSMTIVEPYGVTFVDSLVHASLTGTVYQNYLSQPYMLQLDFHGYDNAGNPLPASQTALYRKRFPIKFTGVKIDVTNRGAEYKVNYYALGHQSFRPEHSTVPKNLSINGVSTVGGFLTAFANALNAFWQLEVVESKVQYADSIVFVPDDTIAISKIVYDKKMSLMQANPGSKKIDVTNGSFSIPAGTQIVDVIDKVLIQSEYLIKQLGVDLSTASDADIKKSLVQVLNTFKTTSQVAFAGVDASGTATPAAFDNAKNTYASQMTYKIHQYPVYDSTHTAAPTLTDSRPNTVKSYNYLYTGKNIDILDFKVHFDTTWYTAIMSYNRQVSASQVSPNTTTDTQLTYAKNILLSPQLLAAAGLGTGIVPVLNPPRYKNVVNDQRDTIGLNAINNPSAQVASSVMTSLYSKPAGDMVTVDLQIVGDPTLIKQDDWLYVPSPNVANDYNSWNIFGQNDFASKYGHIRMDTGTLIVSLTVNTPLDNDSDWTNQGLVFPQPGTYKSLFSGQYKILTIKNTFSGGKFEQTLKLVRLMNSDLVTNSAPDTVGNGRPATGAVGTSQGTGNSLNNSVNNATKTQATGTVAAGDQPNGLSTALGTSTTTTYGGVTVNTTTGTLLGTNLNQTPTLIPSTTLNLGGVNTLSTNGVGVQARK